MNIERIKKSIPEVLEKISTVGITEGITTGIPLNIIYLVNLLSVILSTTMLMVGIAGFAFGISHPFISLYRILLFFVFIVPLLLNSIKRYETAQFYMVFTPPLTLVIMAFLTGVPQINSLRSAMLPIFILPIVLYGIKTFPKMLLGILYMIVASALLEEVSVFGGFLQDIPDDIYNNTAELNINIQMNIGFIVCAVFFYQYLLHITEKELEKERLRSEALLENVLPVEIIPMLKENPEVIAEHFSKVSILFADIADFTSRSEEMDASDIVTMLNEIFSYFDQLTEKYGIEKIKTIGDCYMAASGVPHSREDHAVVLVKMAIEALQYVENRSFHHQDIRFRVGISSGPVVAGVIGKKKFIYDLWGDTVNTASRMESHGSVGTIQITEETKLLVEEFFECEKLDDIHVKGKGKMPVYIVVGEKVQPE